MHHFIRASDIRSLPAFSAEASGYRRASLSDRDCGAVHSGWGQCELDAKGYVNQHLQSFEKSFYVLEGNPLGARALYLGKSIYRIHGTNQPSTIGTFVSSGCIRLTNADVIDLYTRVQVGTRVVVLAGGTGASAASRSASH